MARHLAEGVRENEGGVSKQSRIVTGPYRARVVEEVGKHLGTNGRSRMVQVRPAKAPGTGAGSFWAECWKATGEQWPEPGDAKATAKVEKKADEKVLGWLSEGALVDKAQATEVEWVLVVEDLVELLEHVGKDECWCIRKVLQCTPELCIMGTSPKAGWVLHGYHEAFYGYFHESKTEWIDDGIEAQG